MKKIFLLIAVVLGIAATKVNAQDQPVRFGIRAGVNLADWQGETMTSVTDLIELSDGAVSRSMREGFHVGGYVTIPVLPGFEIEPGLLYSQKGTRITGTLPIEQVDFLNARVNITNKAEYIDLPVLAKLYVADGLYLFGGPQFSYLVSNKVKVQAGALGFNALNREWDMKSGFREFDTALTGGAGYQFTNGLNLSVGYDHGMSTVDQNGNFNTYNRVVKASVGFTF
ncbi:porin family protein [Pontibacter sp. SGAir0037]|uniref:porin family protein n=1 Tax=Pontibacter sp. SGAir0037 TaxID=2571030 RepID=UPI0010CD08EA|nr:porin family protein [Pontibacter sp. SGAir0037]QCR25037.1 PorT family protein [Pontibacter sp. SGAir0037]